MDFAAFHSAVGLSANNLSLNELRLRARMHVFDAINMIPMEQKAAYLEAMEKAPQLFEGETDPLKFLRRSCYNPWDAACRMCLYWRERKSLFGPDRAFLPLVLTGEGALSRDDILSIKAGWPAILTDSRNSQHVIYFDRRQFVASFSMEHRLRSLFYFDNFLSEQSEEALILVLLATPRLPTVDFPMVRKGFDITMNAFMTKVAHTHLMNCPPKPKGGPRKQYLVQDTLSSYLETMSDSGFVFGDELSVHFEREEGDLLNFLANDIGLPTESIPVALGGSWQFTEVLEWCRKQAGVENRNHVIVEKRKRAARPPAPGEGESGDGQKQPRRKMKEEERVSKRRAINAVNSRRKRERRKQEFSSLVEESDQLAQDQEHLRQENSRLEGLLQEAHRSLRTRQWFSL